MLISHSIVLVRHGETAWSAAGRHTGLTDIALTPRGERQAERLNARFARRKFALVLVSPRKRARDTCRLAGYDEVAEVDPDLSEWDYGAYEGRTSAEIRADVPGWTIWDGGVPQGETIDGVASRADRVLARAVAANGDVTLFSHGHLLRVLAARWLGFPPVTGRIFGLDPASVGILGTDSEQRVIELWNDVSHLR
jgi:broad specificity phosphatase PhoE